MALPKRTILFAVYLLLIIAENLGLIASAKLRCHRFYHRRGSGDKIWPEEKETL
ncbi:hypothetical protein [Streptococcus sp.]|uniref:hypothetical protein n=1 Tax=Streptococcus sp. TaxID=1306 RepID=UPI003919DC2D